MRLTLHNYRRCPFCIRVRIVLELKKIPYEIVEEPLRVWTEWMIENIEDKRVPVLRVASNDGTESVMQESNDINLFLDANFGDTMFTPEKNTSLYDEMVEWWTWCSDELKPQIDIYKYGKDLVFEKKKNNENARNLLTKLENLERHLEKSSYLVADKLSLADIAIIPFIRQIMRTRDGEFDFSKIPTVEKWTKDMIKTDWFINGVMRKMS